MRSKTILRFDVFLFFSVFVLMVIGILFIYSSGVSSTGIVFSNEYIRQIIWASTGLGLLIGTAFVDYERLRFFSPYIYFFFIALLIFTLFFGERVNGARSWLGVFSFGIQPSEFTKIATILFLSAFYANNREGAGSFIRFFTGFVIISLPVGLILIQPDLGTALVYLPIFLFISFIAKAKLGHLLFLLCCCFFLIALIILPVLTDVIIQEEVKIVDVIANNQFLLYSLAAMGGVFILSLSGFFIFKKRYFYWICYGTLIIIVSITVSLIADMLLRDYQLMRLIVFLDPSVDPQGAGWNIIQSLTAVGSGGMIGKGFLSGTQSHYQFLPQQSTDFIFSIIAEEWGFLGGLLVFALFGLIFARGIIILSTSKDDFSRYIATGILGMVFFHFLINIGMSMGIMPITGIPLFFLSYGGSSLWTAAIGVGILINIHRKSLR